jgi:DhnA family fructose-bisphosphate aldolase class Ia
VKEDVSVESIGKQMRLRRLLRPDTGRCILFAASHGTSTQEVFPALEDTRGQIRAALAGGSDAVLVSRGFAREAAPAFAEFPGKAWVLKVSATAYEDMPRELLISGVEGAALSGADAVGVLMQLTPSTEVSLLSMISHLGEECERLQMPFVVEAELPGAYDRSGWYPEDKVAYLRRSCRLAQELGADVIKTNWPGDAEGFAEVISAVTLPVVVAGGARVEEDVLLKVVEDALGAGAVGCSVGRNIFQASDPQAMARRIAELVHSPTAVTA